jgi:hypothetical protein
MNAASSEATGTTTMNTTVNGATINPGGMGCLRLHLRGWRRHGCFGSHHPRNVATHMNDELGGYKRE